MTTSQCYLKFQSLNVEGISNQLKHDAFLSNIKKFDFISLVETWLSESSKINIERYYCFKKGRRKAKKARRYSGGICILVKKTLKKGVQFFSSKSDRFVWWKLDKQFLIWKKAYMSVLLTYPHQILNILDKAVLIHTQSYNQT